jgi:hypothetical protein
MTPGRGRPVRWTRGESQLQETISGLVMFVLLCASATLGMLVRPRLPEQHRSRETTELMQITIGLMVTFAALVLGLLTASVKQRYDHAAQDRQAYALELTLMDQCLRDYGPGTETARADIRSYTAAVIASTWPSEPPPVGVQYPDTTNMPRTGASPVLRGIMNQVGMELIRLAPADPGHVRILDLCLDRYKAVLQARLAVIEDARVERYDPFYTVLAFWLMIIFTCFGLVAPGNYVSKIVIVLCAISLSSVMFVIVDLAQPYGGYFSIASDTMRTALDAMLAPAP